MKLKHFMFALVAMLSCFTFTANAQNVAKVGNTEYATIDEAISNWGNGSTLTLMADVTLSDVIKLSSTEYHILDLGTYTMTAASGKDAIQYVVNGRSSASYALDIKADATNPGGITATGKAIVSHIKPKSNAPAKDRPITRFYGGVFNASYVVKQGGTGLFLPGAGYTGASAPYFQFYGGEFNGTIYTNRSQVQFHGGVFNGSIQMSVDSSSYGLVAGGTFKNLSNSMGSALNSDKFTIGSEKGVYDKEVYVDENGNYVISASEPTEGIEADVAKTPGTNDYLAYSKVATEGQLGYTNVETALKNNTSATVTVYADEVDMSGINFKGTIVVPEGNDITITNAPSTLTVQLSDGTVLTPDANGTVATKFEVATLDELQTALASTANVPIVITAQIEIPADETVELDLNGKTVNSVFNGTSTTNHIYALSNKGTLTIKDSKGNGSINSRGIYNYGSLTLNDGAINAIDGNGGYAVNNQSGSTFVMNGGVVAATNEDDHQSSSGGFDATALKVPTGCTATLNGGTINNVCDFTYAIDAAGTLNIPETSVITVNGTHGAIAVSGGVTTIDAGTFQIPADNYSRTDNVLYVSGGSLVVNGGTFIGDSDTAGGGSCLYDAAGKAVVNGGTFKGSSGGDVWGTTGTTIKGGTFENLTEKQHIAAGYELNADGTVAAKPVASINGTKYTSLSEAVAAVQEGETITLIDNVVLAERVTIPADKTLTIDLNGKSISMEESIIATAYAINNLGNLTITDGVGGGSINARGVYNGYGDGGANVATAKITVVNGTINAKGTNGGGAAIFNYGVADIQGGTFTSVASYAIALQTGSTMTIGENAIITGGINSWQSTLTITGGTISNDKSGKHVVYAGESAVTINGGTFHNNNSGNATIMASGSTAAVEITGGTFTLNIVDASSSYLIDATSSATYTISGGSFTGGIRAQGGTKYEITGGTFTNEYGNYNVYEGGDINISGGTFTGSYAQTFAKNNIAEDYKLGEDGKVVYAPVVAKIGETKYETLDAAVAAAKEGDKITLLNDADLAFAHNPQYNNVYASEIDLNGKTMTIKKGDVRFDNVTIKNGNIIVQSGTYNGTAIFLMYSKNLTFEGVKVTATGVAAPAYLIGLEGTSNLNLLNGSEIVINNESLVNIGSIIADNGNGNTVTIKDSKIEITNSNARLYLGGTNGNITVENSDIDLNGVKEGFYLRAGQTLAITGNSTVDITLITNEGRYGINLTDITATYTKAETATVNATLKEITPAAVIGTQKFATLQTAVDAAVLMSGDVTIEVMAGTYAENINLTNTAVTVGDANARPNITFKPAAGADVTLAGTTTLGYRIQNVGASMWQGEVIFEGIKFNHAENGKHSLDIQDVKGITLLNCTITGDGEYGIGSNGSNATPKAAFTNCTFENGAMQVLGQLSANLVIDGCTFDEFSVNAQGGAKPGLTIKNSTFNLTLTDAHVGESFYAVRSNANPINIQNTKVTVDSELSSVAADQAKWGLFWARKDGKDVQWNVASCEVNLTDAAMAQTELPLTKNDGTANAFQRIILTDLTSTSNNVADLIKRTEGCATVNGINYKDGERDFTGLVAKIGDEYYATLQAAIEAVQEGETVTVLEDITFTTGANGSTNGISYTRGVSFTLDLNGKTITSNLGNNALRFKIGDGNTVTDTEVTVLIKNGKIVSGSNNWCAISAATADNSGNKLILNLTDLTIEANKAGDFAVKSWAGAVVNTNNVDVTSNYAGGFYAVGGEIVLDENSSVAQKGLHTAPYMSYAFGVSSGTGKMTVNGGTYSAVPAAASDANNQGASHGSSVGGVMSSGGTLIINGGTFSNDNFGDAAPTAPRSLIMADAGAVVTINGGTFNAMAKIVDPTNNTGVASKNAVVTIAGGTYSANPTDAPYNLVKLAENYVAVENNGVWNVVKAAAKIETTGYATLAEAVKAVKEGETITILAGTHSEGTIKLPVTLKNVTIKGESVARSTEGAVLKDMTISAADGNAYSYVGLTFDGITFDNSRILLTGWRNGDEIIENLAVTNCTFKNLDDNTNSAPIHINKEANEPVNGFTFTNNVIDGATGGSKSGIYAQVTGAVKVENNIINNVSFRPYVIQVTTDDGIADNFTVKGNTFSGSAAGRAQGLGNNAEGTDNVNLVVSNNIFKGITEAQQICYWNFNPEKTTADLSKNYYDIDIEANPNKIYFNSPAADNFALRDMNVFPIYTALNEDGTINTESAFTPKFYIAKVGENSYETLSEAFAAVTDDAQTVVVLRDVTENLTGAYLRGNITTENGAKVTITLTNSDWVYCPYTFVIGENVTLKVPALFYYAGGAQINGTVIADAYYQRYANTKLTINEPGSMTVTTEMFYLRYVDGDANAGIYINGDNNDETIGLNLAVAYFYQGMINAKNANIKAGTYWQTNETDGQGSANLVLDNSKLVVTVYDHPAKATGNSTVTLTNGSTLDARNGGFTYGDAATLSVDATSKIIGKNGALVELPVAKIGTTKYTSLQAAINAAAEGATITMISDCELTAQNAQELFKPAYNRESYCGISIPDDKAIVLDLNGCTVSYVDAYGDVDNVMVLNLGNLTINDSQGGGKLTYKPVAGAKTYTYFYSTIFNCGTLTINAGTVENTCETETDVTNAVDNHSRLSHEYGNDCVLTVNGGTLSGAYYYAIRQYTHYLEGVQNRVVINGGDINGGVYMQHGDSWYYANAESKRLNVDCYLTINGGNINVNTTPDAFGKIKSRLSNPDNNVFGLAINGGNINVPVELLVQRGVYYTNGVSGATTPAETAGTRNAEWLEKNGGFITGGTFAEAGSTATTNIADFVAEGYMLVDNADGTYGVVEAPKGNNFLGYTSTEGIWGEVWGNARESFVIKVLDANDNVMGTTSLNNVGGIIDGDVNVSWNLKFNAAANTDEYWTMAWTTAPTLNNMPAKVELWVDGTKVSGGPVVLNGPDDLNKINVIVTDAEGKVTSCQTTVANALAAAEAGAIITLLADVTEDVTTTKAVTIDGAGKTYTGKMTLKADATIKNVNFDGKGYNGYAVETRGANYLTIEDCTAMNYGYGFVQLASGTVLTTVKNVTVSDMNYGVKVDYSNAVVLENVDITAGVAAVLNSNYGEKTITIKNSKLNILGTWKRNETTKTTYVFEGANTVGQFITDAAIDNFTLAHDATLTAPEDLVVVPADSDCPGADYESVVYENGVYKVECSYIDELNLIDGQFDEFENQNVKIVGTLTYQRTFPTVWTPIYVPFEIPVAELAEQGFEVAYINGVRRDDKDYDGELDEFVMEIIYIHGGNANGSGKTLKANYPYFIKATSGVTQLNLELNDVTLYKSEDKSYDCTTMTEKFVITGNNRKMTSGEFGSNMYVVGQDKVTGETGWGTISNGSSLKPFRVYMTVTDRENLMPVEAIEFMSIAIRGEQREDGSTFIYDVEMDAQQPVDYIYDLQGRRVLEPQKGNLYIINGKKVIF